MTSISKMAMCGRTFCSNFGLLLIFTLTRAFDDGEFISGDGLSTLVVEHSLSEGVQPEFVRRGTISITSFKSGNAQYTDDTLLSSEDKVKLKNLALNGGLYRIRVGYKPSGSDKMQYVSAFTRACAVVESKLTDLLTVNVDLSGSIIGVSINTKYSFCTSSANGRGITDSFKTTVEIIQTVPGPAPETQSYIEKLEHERIEKLKGQGQDNRSFFAKYWMYLVPVFIFLMFASNADPQAQGR